MAAFEQARQRADQEVMVTLLTRLAENPAATQRSLASELGIALGMMSQYMKSCVLKGYVRAKQVTPQRWAYFVTPAGFAEKSRMAVTHLAHAMSFFRQARAQVEALFKVCHAQGFSKIALVGPGDVADIAHLVAKEFDLCLTVCEKNDDLSGYDRVLITDLQNPQGTYDYLKEQVGEATLLNLPILCIARKRVKTIAQIGRK